MADAFIGEIRAFGFNYPPVDWAYCWGQQIAISQYYALYAIIGVMYGGDARTVFNVPDLRGMVTLGTGTASVDHLTATFLPGQVEGTPTATITPLNMPAHTHQAHAVQVNSNTSSGPTANAFVSVPRNGSSVYDAWTPHVVSASRTQLSPSSLAPFGGNAAGGVDTHSNISPFLAMNFCICTLSDVFPVKP